jgi:PleD family two-component response regulator
MSLSLGVTCLQHCNGRGDADSLIRQVDTALYSAKRTGSNRVCVSEL